MLTADRGLCGGYNGAITAPMLQYLQQQWKDVLGITMNLKVMPTKDWMDGMLNHKNNLFLAPYEYDYLDPSNFYGIFYNGGRHDHHRDPGAAGSRRPAGQIGRAHV